jgi:hypothetical protein
MKRRKFTPLIIAGILVTGLGVLFAPSLYSLYWRLAHSGHTEIAERRVKVPPLYYVKTEGKEVHINKLAFTVLAKRPATALITLWPNVQRLNSEAQKEAAFQSFASMYWTNLAGEAGVTTGPVRRGLGQNESVCMQTAYPTKRPYEWLAVSCLASQGNYFATFYGEPKELTAFYEIIDNL